RPATRDFMPVLGPSPSLANVFYATGHLRSGILLSAITGEILADLVNGRQLALDLAPFSPRRFSVVTKVKALGLVRDILFRSRICLKALSAARDAGFDTTLSRNEFTTRLAELLKA